MNNQSQRLWPFRSTTSIILSLVILFSLMFAGVTLHRTVNWPSQNSEGAMLLGVLVFSLIPVLLLVLNTVIERGGVIEYQGAKIDFSQVSKQGIPGITIPENIGVPGQPVTDSSTTIILEALRQAAASDVVVIDLEEGKAWWETRLLVLLAGAERLGKPTKFVFVGTDGGVKRHFEGWGRTDELFRLLLLADTQYARSHQAARAASRQWSLVEPFYPTPPGAPAVAWPQPPFPLAGLAAQHPWMVFDSSTGLKNELLPEQLLAADLGTRIEAEIGPKFISLARLDDLFRPVLYKTAIDESWPPERQLREFLGTDCSDVALTRNGTYSILVPRVTMLNEIVRVLVQTRSSAESSVHNG